MSETTPTTETGGSATASADEIIESITPSTTGKIILAVVAGVVLGAALAFVANALLKVLEGAPVASSGEAIQSTDGYLVPQDEQFVNLADDADETGGLEPDDLLADQSGEAGEGI